MSEQKHTAGPWIVCDRGDYSDFDGESNVILADDRRIAAVHQEYNAAHIVKCVNCHDDLLAALKGLMALIENPTIEHDDTLPEIVAANAALNKAEGKPQ